jgi:two-component system alkaline phosphatase synthesis response regulator PhoP
MPRVAIAEDEELIRTMLRLNLEKDGYEVESFESAEELLESLEHGHFDVLLLDVMLPGMSGEDVIVRIREKGINTPILMVTARADIETKVSTFRKGADDYLSKPFDMEELLLRVKALIRRSQGEREIPSHNLVRIDDYEVNLETRMASTRQGEVKLSEKECDLLRLFGQYPGKTLLRADILEEVWGMDVFPTPRTIDNFILKFRKLFEENPEEPVHFITVRSAGYRFVP